MYDYSSASSPFKVNYNFLLIVTNKSNLLSVYAKMLLIKLYMFSVAQLVEYGASNIKAIRFDAQEQTYWTHSAGMPLPNVNENNYLNNLLTIVCEKWLAQTEY